MPGDHDLRRPIGSRTVRPRRILAIKACEALISANWGDRFRRMIPETAPDADLHFSVGVTELSPGFEASIAAYLIPTICSSSRGVTLAGVDRRVGYATPLASSSAFKRLHRVTPRDYREAATPSVSSG
jgi:AraC-like DNA-binding protein